MPKISIKKQTGSSKADAYSKVKSMLNDDKDLKKLDPSYKCDFDDSKMSGKATGKLFKAELVIEQTGSGCEVEIIVDLPLALSLAKGMVQKTLQKKLDSSLA